MVLQGIIVFEGSWYYNLTVNIENETINTYKNRTVVAGYITYWWGCVWLVLLDVCQISLVDVAGDRNNCSILLFVPVVKRAL